MGFDLRNNHRVEQLNQALNQIHWVGVVLIVLDALNERISDVVRILATEVCTH